MESSTAFRSFAPDSSALDAARERASQRRRLVFTRWIPVVCAMTALALILLSGTARAPVRGLCNPFDADRICDAPNALEAKVVGGLALAVLTAIGALAMALRARRRLRDDALALGLDANALAAGVPRKPRQAEVVPLYLLLHEDPTISPLLR